MTRSPTATFSYFAPVALAALCGLLVGSCATTAATAPVPKESTVAVAADPNRDFKVLGRDDAPVTIIEFTDLQCPYCARFAQDTFPHIRERYVDTGLVRFASTDLPLPMHTYAIPAAVAARCAGEQGHYWEYREKLFAQQGQLEKGPYDAIALRMKLDLDAFRSCRQDGRQQQQVRSDAARAASFGISATPTFVIGRMVNGEFEGETLSGAQTIATFAEKIDALLAAP